MFKKAMYGIAVGVAEVCVHVERIGAVLRRASHALC